MKYKHEHNTTLMYSVISLMVTLIISLVEKISIKGVGTFYRHRGNAYSANHWPRRLTVAVID